MLPKEIIAKIRRIEITTSKLVTDSLAGQYESVFKGRGIELDEVREYQEGDDVRPRERARPKQREVEHRRAAAVLGVKRVIPLGYSDGDPIWKNDDAGDGFGNSGARYVDADSWFTYSGCRTIY